ncbi:MAG TPA: hypothetical protein VNG31_07925 [Candidatus Baltobacteraceae bacterium]|nr:hypothetical protein [Candidatus Baltobacteraceae bacterium]
MRHLTRRRFIETGVGGLVLLSLANCGGAAKAPAGSFDDSGYTYRFLTAANRSMIAAVGGAMLAGALPADSAAHGVALVQVVRGVDVAAAGLPPGVQAEIGQLFGLLDFPVTRALAAGVWHSWSGASSADVSAFLTRWRFSGIVLFRSGYQALHQLVMASWYGNSTSWAAIGYPGPPVLG